MEIISPEKDVNPDRRDSALDLEQSQGPSSRELTTSKSEDKGGRLWRSHSVLLRPRPIEPVSPRVETADSASLHRLKHPYHVPLKLDFGHVDVLVGRDAVVLWREVAEWLIKETSRERQSSV